MNSFRVVAEKDFSPESEHQIALKAGTIYCVSEIKENNYLVTNANGDAGWVPGNLLTPLETVNEKDSEKTCKFCKEKIVDQFVSVENDFFHAKCFECSNCKDYLAGKAFIEKDNKMFCEKCYKEMNLPTCAHCNEKISSQYIKALGKNWHPDHFVCTICGKPNKETFRNYQDKPYCDSCFVNKIISNCSRCKKVFTGDDKLIEIANMKLHIDCFICDHGKEPLDLEKTIKMKNDKLYCEPHYNEFIVKRCEKCKKPCTSNSVSAMGKDFHPECFKCPKCDKKFTEVQPMANEGEIICKSCDEKQIKEKMEEEKKMANKKRLLKDVYTAEELRDNMKIPESVVKAMKEKFIDDAEFENIFKMSKSEFRKLPLWNQKKLKRIHRLI